MAFLLALYVFPLFEVLQLSVTEPTPGIDNYMRLFRIRLYANVLINTFEISLIVAFICLLLGYPTAFFLAHATPRLATFLLLCVLIPFFTGVLVRNYSWIFMLGTNGVVNSTLMGIGVIDKPLALLYNRTGVLIGMVHVLLPYTILVLYSVMRGIDPRLVLAAESLGAAPFSAFRRVFLPLSLPGVGGGFLLVFVISLAFFITPAMLGGVGETMIANLIARQVGVLNWGFAGALSAVLLLSSLAGILLMQHFFGGAALIAPGLGHTKARYRLTGREGPVLAAIDRLLEPIWRFVPPVVGGAVLAYLVLPILIMLPLSVSPADYLVFPPQGFSWRWYAAFFTNADWLEATWNSFVIASMTAVLTMALAVPAAIGITRSTSRITGAIYLLILSPMIVPTIITAIAVFFLFSRFYLTGTVWGVALGHTIVSLPLVTVVMVSALRNFDRNLERAALSLGAGPVRTIVRVVLPTIKTATFTGAMLAFLHSFDEVILAIFISGIRARTLPKMMWESLQEINPIITAVSTLLIIFAFAVVIALYCIRRTSNRMEISIMGGR